MYLPGRKYGDKTATTPDFTETVLKIYPNPLENKLFITGSTDVREIQVLDIIGQKLLNIQSTHTVELNSSNFKSGFYLVRFVNDSGESFTKKVFKK